MFLLGGMKMKIDHMNKDIMSYIFTFTGNNNFYFIASVSKRWYKYYLMENNKKTSVKLVSF